MENTYSKVLLVTANVGSLFEDPEKLIPIWMQEFTATLRALTPEFLAIHCQEIGGKNYDEKSAEYVNRFITMLLAIEDMEQFDRFRIFLDEDFTAIDKFTALGSLYFVHHTVTHVEMFDFQEACFVPMQEKELLSGNIDKAKLKEKAKFAQSFFPDLIWSRKGFIRTRWNLHGTVFDLINIHLFHDESNLVALEKSPSMYSVYRKNALLYILERFETDRYRPVPFFLFGDFNFRLDTKVLVQELTRSAEEQRQMGKKNDLVRLVYKEPDNGKVLLSISKKEFNLHNHNEVFCLENASFLTQFDKELECCQDKVHEYPRTFPQSYPFSEDSEVGTRYMRTRCPGWCDRILVSKEALGLLYKDDNIQPEYRMIGTKVCMGDHKPIYLNLKIRKSMTGKLDGVVEHGVLSRRVRHAPLKKVYSINGEEIEVDSPEAINIHDYTSFVDETCVNKKLLGSIRRKEVEDDGQRRPCPTFKQVVEKVMKKNAILRAMRNYSHRSDSETEDECSEPMQSKCSSSDLPRAAVEQINLSFNQYSEPSAAKSCGQESLSAETKTSVEHSVETNLNPVNANRSSVAGTADNKTGANHTTPDNAQPSVMPQPDLAVQNAPEKPMSRFFPNSWSWKCDIF